VVRQSVPTPEAGGVGGRDEGRLAPGALVEPVLSGMPRGRPARAGGGPCLRGGGRVASRSRKRCGAGASREQKESSRDAGYQVGHIASLPLVVRPRAPLAA